MNDQDFLSSREFARNNRLSKCLVNSSLSRILIRVCWNCACLSIFCRNGAFVASGSRRIVSPRAYRFETILEGGFNPQPFWLFQRATLTREYLEHSNASPLRIKGEDRDGGWERDAFLFCHRMTRYAGLKPMFSFAPHCLPRNPIAEISTIYKSAAVPPTGDSVAGKHIYFVSRSRHLVEEKNQVWNDF